MTGLLFGIAAFFLFATLWYASGFALGHTYNYLTRKKTYNGTKMLVCFVISCIAWNLI